MPRGHPDILKRLSRFDGLEEVLYFNVCAMRGLSRVLDEFFEEYVKLTRREQFTLCNILRKAHLPVVQLF